MGEGHGGVGTGAHTWDLASSSFGQRCLSPAHS